jgi:serine protease DegS
VKARLGIERDQAAAEEKVTKVSGFLPSSQAEGCGLHLGDVIKKVDGLVPGGSELYWSKAVRWKVGDKVKVEVERDGKPMEFEVELSAG